MRHILIFGGTGDSREIVKRALENGFFVTLCVTTEYAATLLEAHERLKISVKRLEGAEMLALMKKGEFFAVIDATHPYAVIASQNIKAAASEAGVKYLRLSRPKSSFEGCAVVKNAQQAANLLEKSGERVFIATGIKELPVFSKVKNICERAYVRVLPTIEAIGLCEGLGFKASHIIAMQGPFDEELNAALFRRFKIETLVTKDGGAQGGFPEKIAAARRCNVKVLLIERPCDEGFSQDEILEFLEAGR